MSSTTSLAATNVLPVLREFLSEVFDELEEAGDDEGACLELAGQISAQKEIIDNLIRSNTRFEDDLAASIDLLHAWIATHIRKNWAEVAPVWKEWLSIRKPGRAPKRLTNVPGSVKENVGARSESMEVPHTSENTKPRASADGTTVRDGSEGFGSTADAREMTGEVRDATRGTTSGDGPPLFEGLSPEVRMAVERGERRAMERTTGSSNDDGLETETIEVGKRLTPGSLEKGKEKEGEEVNDDGAADDGAGETEEEEDRDEDEGDAPSGSMDPDNARAPRTTRNLRIRSRATVSDTEEEDDEDAEKPPARTTRKRNASNPPEEPRKRLRKAVVEVPAKSSSSHGSNSTAEVNEGKGIELTMREWFTAECMEKKPVEFRKELLEYLLKCRKEDHKDYSSVCDWCATTGISRCFGPTKTKTCFYCVRMKKKCSHREKTGQGKGKTKEKKPEKKEKKSDGRGKGKTRAEAVTEEVGKDVDITEDDAAGSTQPALTPRKVTLRVTKTPNASGRGSSSLSAAVKKTLDADNELGLRSAQITTLRRDLIQWKSEIGLLQARVASVEAMLAWLEKGDGEVE